MKKEAIAFLKLRKTLGKDGKDFEKLTKWILIKHPIYKDFFKKIYLWDEWPDRWGIDDGIDLVAEDIYSDYWAIQSKCYDEKHPISKTDIAKFVSASANPLFQHRLLVATTDKIGPIARSTIKRLNKEKPWRQILLNDLINAPLEWPINIRHTSKLKQIVKYSPRPHQKTAIRKITKKLTNRGQLIMACGTGKTLTGLWIDEKLETKITLLLFPSLMLLASTLSEWVSHRKTNFKFMAVCSDHSVTRGLDEIKLSSHDLAFPTTTSKQKIIDFINLPKKKVLFATYQSAHKIQEAFKEINKKSIDLIIADEAHRVAGREDSNFNIVLNNDLIPSKKRLFMTATPKIFTSSTKKRVKRTGVKLISMDDEIFFGKCLHKLSFSDAINPKDKSEPLLYMRCQHIC